ncbi:MAG: stage II sporulation protein P [Syntrophomonas sp.]|nr:stage II sporulation protein P [Syntrophomonas sp.]
MVMHKRFTWIALICLLLLAFSTTALAEEERPSGQYFSLVNENFDIIHQTAMQVYPGDTYIAADNSKYLVTEIKGNTARCIYQGKEPMPEISDISQTQANILNQSIPALNPGEKPTIAVYHTHSDESYVPNDGKESIDGNGGIYDVGAAFVTKLESMGFNVDYNKENHNPHDVNAYNRSRKTAMGLMKKVPAAIIDVHRDAVPPGEYQANVQGQDVTKVKLVVGRSNPTMKTNMEFAKNLKAVMDKKAPGLSDGIFIGKGSYNQDLSPRAMLIEVGAHTNDKVAAEKGVKLFADILPSVLGLTPTTGANVGTNEPAQKPVSPNNQKAGTTILIILVVVGAVIGGFFMLNRGSTSK